MYPSFGQFWRYSREGWVNPRKPCWPRGSWLYWSHKERISLPFLSLVGEGGYWGLEPLPNVRGTWRLNLTVGSKLHLKWDRTLNFESDPCVDRVLVFWESATVTAVVKKMAKWRTYCREGLRNGFVAWRNFGFGWKRRWRSHQNSGVTKGSRIGR